MTRSQALLCCERIPTMKSFANGSKSQGAQQPSLLGPWFGHSTFIILFSGYRSTSLRIFVGSCVSVLLGASSTSKKKSVGKSSLLRKISARQGRRPQIIPQPALASFSRKLGTGSAAKMTSVCFPSCGVGPFRSLSGLDPLPHLFFCWHLFPRRRSF